MGASVHTNRPSALTVSNVGWGPAGLPPIISDISFSVGTGEILAIVGPNGAGKSTLLRCLYRVNRPTTGIVEIDGRDIWSLSQRQVARRIAAVLQELPADFPFKVRDIVAMGRTPHRRGFVTWSGEDRDIVDAALARLNIARFARRTFSSLSGGEKQRVLLARALVQQPKVIILDEPTNHLDIRHQLEMLELMRELGTTIVTTLHDLNLAASVADRILLISDGRMVGAAAPDEILTPETIRSTFSVGAVVDRHPHSGASRFSFFLEAAERGTAPETPQ